MAQIEPSRRIGLSAVIGRVRSYYKSGGKVRKIALVIAMIYGAVVAIALLFYLLTIPFTSSSGPKQTQSTVNEVSVAPAAGAGQPTPGEGSSAVASDRGTMDELLAKMKKVPVKNVQVYRFPDLEKWNEMIGKPDEVDDSYSNDFEKWKYQCSDGILIVEIQAQLLREFEVVMVTALPPEKRPY